MSCYANLCISCAIWCWRYGGQKTWLMTFDIRAILRSDWSRELERIFELDKSRRAVSLRWIKLVVGKVWGATSPRYNRSVVGKIPGGVSELGKPLWAVLSNQVGLGVIEFMRDFHAANCHERSCATELGRSRNVQCEDDTETHVVRRNSITV